MFKVFAFGFETRNKTISSLIYRLINEALLVADHNFSEMPFQLMDITRWFLIDIKHVPAFRFQSESPGAGAMVWFSCSQGWKWMVHRTIIVMSCCSNSCCHTSVKLLVTFTFQCTTHAQEHQAAVTQDSGLHTRQCGLRVDQTRPQSCRLRECIYQKQQGSSYITDKLRLLTE